MTIPSQLSAGDVKKLRAIQKFVAQKHSYVYLEIGSYLGGSLYPHLQDPRCTAAWSIDTRSTDPIRDERNIDYAYTVSTQDMLDLFDQHNIPTQKLHTVDGTVSQVQSISVDLVFIDGEHTNSAAYSDAVQSLRFQPSIVMFHDDWIVSEAIDQFQQHLSDHNIQAHTHKLLDSDITAVVIGDLAASFAESFKRQTLAWQQFVPQAQQKLHKGKCQ